MSQGEDPPYPRVVDAVERFAESAGSNDHLSLLTFDAVPNLRYSDTVDAGEVVAALPDEAVGPATDVGAALAAALDRLERPDASDIQLLVFLTDGEHSPPAGSRFSTTSGPVWEALRERGEAAAERRRLQVYGAGLEDRGATDIALVQQVFADTRLNSLPADQLESFFDEIVLAARIEKLREPLQEELDSGALRVEASRSSFSLSETATVKVRVTSPLTKLPVSVQPLAVGVVGAPAGTSAEIPDDQPAELILEPGGSAEFEVELTNPVESEEFRLGESTEERTFTLEVEMAARAEPADVIERDVGLDPVLPVEAKSIQITLSRGVGVPWTTVGFIGLLILGALLGTFFLYRTRFRRPGLEGRIVVPGGSDIELSGTSMRVPPDGEEACEVFTRRGRSGSTFARPVAGTVRIMRRGGRREVLAGDEELLPGDRIEAGTFRGTWFG